MMLIKYWKSLVYRRCDLFFGGINMAQSFPEKLIEDLGYYVYMYSDPKTKKPFYVGKGTGNRAFSHLNFYDDTEDSSEKLKKIAEIRKRGIT